MNFKRKKQNGGYIALSTVLFLGAITLAVNLTVSLISINEGQLGFAHLKSEESLGLVESCAEEALLLLNETNNIPTTISLPEGDCTTTTDSQSGNNWTFTVNGTFDNHSKSLQLEVTKTDTISITSWKEV